MTLPEIIPIFPLPNVVLFPRMPLPLHIFEPRYRDMVRAAVRGPGLIGMALLRGDWERDYEGRPPVFTAGTVGQIVRREELPDGRFNIVLLGLREYVIERELVRASYREAVVRWREPEVADLPAGLRGEIVTLVGRYLERLGKTRDADPLPDPAVDQETFVNFFAQHLDVAPLEKQAMLEAPTLADRARRLRDILEFHLEELRGHPGGPSGRAH